jgi:hypothetical protein
LATGHDGETALVGLVGRTRVLALVGLVVGLLAAAAFHAAPGAHAQTPPLRVSMYGDSVMLGARDQLLSQFAGQQVTVDAMEDRSLLGAIGMFQAAGPALGDVVVLDLGYNDSDDPATFRGRIDGAMAALSGVRRVFWANQHEWAPGRAGMNAELTAAAARYPTLEVIDWNAEVVAHPDYVYADGIHLTPSGQPAFAALVKQHVDHWVDSLSPTTTSTTAASTTSTLAPAGASGAARTAAASADSGDDGVGTVAVVAGVVVVVAVVLAVSVVVSRRRRRRRRARRQARGGTGPPGPVG